MLADEAYRKIVYSDEPLPELFRIYDLVISVTSHSKDLALPGERIGYVAISPQIKECELLVSGLMIANRVLGFVNAPALFQRLVAGFQRIRSASPNIEKKRDFLYETLMEAGFECVEADGRLLHVPEVADTRRGGVCLQHAAGREDPRRARPRLWQEGLFQDCLLRSPGDDTEGADPDF